MKSPTVYLRLILAQLASLENPATDAALVAVVVKLLPFVHVNTADLLEIAAAVGLVATWVQRTFTGVPATAKQIKLARRQAKRPHPLPAADSTPPPIVAGQGTVPDPPPVVGPPLTTEPPLAGQDHVL